VDLFQILLLIAVVVFAIAAFLSKSLVAVGLALFAGAFLSKTL
jgi:hypothetical protein